MDAGTGTNIAQTLQEFLNDQKQRLSERTFRQYESIIDLYQSYLNSYWPGHEGEAGLDMDEPGHRYVDRFGPEKIPTGFDEFLGYFMPRKVIAGADTMRAAGTVTRKLASWLAERGDIEKKPATERKAARRGTALAKSSRALRLLDQFVAGQPPYRYGSQVEDHFWVERVAPGEIWLEPLLEANKVLGPIAVPVEVTELLEEGWDIGGVVGRRGRTWHLVEVWNISP